MTALHTSLEAWQSDANSLVYKTHQVFYKQAGSGPVLLLIHGFPTASWDWHKVWPDLIHQFQVVAPDMLGFGFSDKPRPYPYSITDQADLLEHLLRNLSVDSFHILAHDYGDTVAQELLARQNEGSLQSPIQSVCFLNGGLFPGVHKPRLIQKLLASPVGRLLTPFLGKRNLSRTFQNIFGKNSQPTSAELDAFWQLIDYDNGKEVIPLLIRYMAERRTHEQRWYAALQQSSIPMRLIDGCADPISGKHLAEHYRKHVPLADVIELEGIGHYPQTEAPLLVTTHYLEFFNQHFRAPALT